MDLQRCRRLAARRQCVVPAPVDEYVNNRLADSEVHSSALGWLLITAAIGNADKTAVAELLGRSDHPLGKLGEIAEMLLQPLADDALIAQAEDGAL
jgi:hypothetical protein